jgi:hypothetical protein
VLRYVEGVRCKEELEIGGWDGLRSEGLQLCADSLRPRLLRSNPAACTKPPVSPRYALPFGGGAIGLTKLTGRPKIRGVSSTLPGPSWLLSPPTLCSHSAQNVRSLVDKRGCNTSNPSSLNQ